MQTSITVEDLQHNLSAFLQRVESGEALVLMKAGKPVAEIRPVASNAAPSSSLRPYGLCAGEFIVPDDFDAPLPDDIIAEFEGR